METDWSQESNDINASFTPGFLLYGGYFLRACPGASTDLTEFSL